MSSLAIQGHQSSGPRRVLPSFTYVGHTCMSFNPKSHTSNPTTHNLAPITSSHIVMRFLNSYVLNMQSGSSQPPMLSCTIRQFPTSYTPNIQSGSSRPPMFSMYKQAVLDLPCSQCSLVPRPHPDFISQPWRKIRRRPGSKTTS